MPANAPRAKAPKGRPVRASHVPKSPVGRGGRSPAGRPPVQRIRNSRGQFVDNNAGFVWHGLDAIIDNMHNVSNTFYNRTRREAARLADRMEAYGKNNARWSDRTGDARRGLKAIVVDSTNRQGFTVAFGHSVDYGYYLEYAHGGRYAIIFETVLWAQQQLATKVATDVWRLEEGESW